MILSMYAIYLLPCIFDADNAASGNPCIMVRTTVSTLTNWSISYMCILSGHIMYYHLYYSQKTDILKSIRIVYSSCSSMLLQLLEVYCALRRII